MAQPVAAAALPIEQMDRTTESYIRTIEEGRSTYQIHFGLHAGAEGRKRRNTVASAIKQLAPTAAFYRLGDEDFQCGIPTDARIVTARQFDFHVEIEKVGKTQFSWLSAAMGALTMLVVLVVLHVAAKFIKPVHHIGAQGVTHATITAEIICGAPQGDETVSLGTLPATHTADTLDSLISEAWKLLSRGWSSSGFDFGEHFGAFLN